MLSPAVVLWNFDSTCLFNFRNHDPLFLESTDHRELQLNLENRNLLPSVLKCWYIYLFTNRILTHRNFSMLLAFPTTWTCSKPGILEARCVVTRDLRNVDVGTSSFGKDRRSLVAAIVFWPLHYVNPQVLVARNVQS